MAVPSSGPLKLYKDIWGDEIGDPQGDNSLHDAAIYAGFSTPDAMSDFYGWSDVIPPSVTTNAFTNVSPGAIRMNGTVTDTGGENVTRGFYFGTNANAPTNNTKLNLGGTQGVGAFTCYRGTSQGTTYYAWAHACNSAGACIGSRVNANTGYPPFTPLYTECSYPNKYFRQSSNGNGLCCQYYFNPYSGGLGRYNPATYNECLYVPCNSKMRLCTRQGHTAAQFGWNITPPDFYDNTRTYTFCDVHQCYTWNTGATTYGHHANGNGGATLLKDCTVQTCFTTSCRLCAIQCTCWTNLVPPAGFTFGRYFDTCVTYCGS
jgi:hypothetical protein